MKKIQTVSWALFDFAETVFSANIISVFFPLWIVNTLGGSSYHYSFVYSTSVIFSILLGILTGKFADERGVKDKFFKLFVVGVIFFLYSMYFAHSLFSALVLFFIMNILYQQSLIFYNSLLHDISEGKDKGLVSGIGIGIGYIGGVISLLIANYLSETPAQTFLITAVIFTLFALPSVFFISSAKKKSANISIKGIIKDRKFLLFILSILFLTDAAHGLIIFMSVYLNKVFGMSQDEIVNVIAFAGIFAIISAPVSGYILKKLSPAIFMKYVFLGWISGFILLVLSTKLTIYVVAVLFGIFLASLWTTMRVVLIDISPSQQLTTRFAFMAMSERMASVLSPITWGVIVYILGEGAYSYKIAAAVLGLFPLIGLIIYLKFLKLLDM
ncbi:MFS transporter, UMF1 family [Persephonella hydrogeniphila]|uniref:MFS transporter, UMF1 family n=1 Tax=Persephonella hydrogeniphila TaxID=198703 RepID=A0A285NE81_9AQUI|nr:MFS transporter [Persephonella hydrogeniphila]SNZ07802.1 MFS transporter, UMF1 family [Persephonella hydrogeniphila]